MVRVHALVFLLLGSAACSGAAPAAPSAATASAAPAAPEPAVSPSGAPPATSAKDDEIAVARAFTAYRDALIARDGARASALVDAGSVAGFERHRRDALTLSRSELAKRPLVEKFMVLRIRHELTRAQLETSNGEALLRLGVERGWTGAKVPELGRIVVHGDTAEAAPAGTDVFVLFFVREAGAWKIDLTRLMALGDGAFRQMYERSERSGGDGSEEDFVLALIGKVSNARVDRAILDGPR